MKQSRFTDSQIIGVLKEAKACRPVSELCREHGISSATFTSGVRNTAAWIYAEAQMSADILKEALAKKW